MPNDHLQDRVLEDYAVGVLADAEIARVRTHISDCRACETRSAKIGREVRILQAALRALAEEPLDFTHETADGPVHLRAERHRGKWQARVGGGAPELRSSFSTPRHANTFLRALFSDLYPRHTCTPACHPGPPQRA